MQNQTTQKIQHEFFVDSVTQYLTFILNNEIYGINILNIKEIIDFGNIARVPMMPKFIAGVINLRGSVVPVVDLALRFANKPSKRTRRSSIIILEVKNDEQVLEIGITVDVVNEVLDILVGEIEQAPSFGTKIRTDFISGMGKVDDQLLVLLDIENILSVDELSAIEGE
ncbi:Positive regulator of CheA protein activity (CheW) [hydrothermal vent metagenome]|uniref:Positive regulator of CheA protein activity (CheW) n=1 Tax=hydrothermal vent metagenome TaxID=652676 RepID=A0A3B0XJQ3_9ZZZZ